MHCFAHRTSLAVSDAVKKCPLMRDILNYALEIEKLVKLSPKRERELKLIKESNLDKRAGITSFCSTRWTAKKRGFYSILLNYEPLLTLFDEARRVESVPDMKACLNGIFHKMLDLTFILDFVSQLRFLAKLISLPQCYKTKIYLHLRVKKQLRLL